MEFTRMSSVPALKGEVLWTLAGLFVGGVCGSMARLVLFALQPADVFWPWVTMSVNLAGSLLLGLLTAIMAVLGADVGAWKRTRLVVGTGVIGAFTTYSTFVLEGVMRILSGAAVEGFVYLVSCAVLGVWFAWGGLVAGRGLGCAVSGRRGRGVHIARDGAVESSVSQGKRAAGIGVIGPVCHANWRTPLYIAAVGSVVLVVSAFGFGLNHWRASGAVKQLMLASLLGGLGTVMRYTVDGWVSRRGFGRLAWGTVVVNVTACLAIGLVWGWTGVHAGFDGMRYLLASGLLGGYSTFSTASVDGARLVGSKRYGIALLYVGTMLLAGIMAVVVGSVLGK
jgi:fluoride exporter